MARLQAPSAQETLPPAERDLGFQFSELPYGELEVSSVVDGMLNRVPRDEVPQGSGRVILNGRVRDDWTGRRPGTVIFGPTKPNSNPVLAVITFVGENGTVYFCRLTATSFHVLGANQSIWLAFDIEDEDGAATTFGGAIARFSFAQFFDNLFISDDAQNRLWFVDFVQSKVKRIKGAPRGRYITMFGERIIAANLRRFVGGVRPGSVQWPVNADPFDWEGLGSGNEDLAAQNIGDEITGLFGLERELIILRRRSIWHGTRQPFAAAPFRFLSVIDNIGCDLPHSAVRVPTGLIFADQRTRDVYFYQPGARPQPLGAAVNRDLFDDIGRLDFAQGSYDPFEKEYHLGIATSDGANISRVWVYSLEKEAWTLDIEPEITALGIVSLPGVSPIIDELIGTIDAQFPEPTGAIDDYREAGGLRPALLKGTASGDVILHTPLAGEDYDNCQYRFVFRSPNVGSPLRRRTVKDLSLRIEASLAGDYALGILKTEDPPNYAVVKEGEVPTGRSNLRLPKKSVTGDDLFWELQTNAPGFRLFSWWIRILEKGQQR